MSNRAWACAFCNQNAVFRDGDEQVATFEFRHPLIGYLQQRDAIVVHLEFCPNARCKQTALTIDLWSMRQEKSSREHNWVLDKPKKQSRLMPESSAKEFPIYIPAAILADYREACRMVSLSPKASGTLARRCLQAMIRDFWGIKKSRLKDEVDALEDKVDSETWDAIDSVRKIGNIGAHMEADINLIVDIDPDEADLLIGLIETLLSDWYIARHNREERIAKIKALSEEKQRARNGIVAAAPAAPGSDSPPAVS